MERDDSDDAPSERERDFVAQSEKGPMKFGLAAELIAFLKHNKKWWLLPIIIVLLLIGALVILGSSALAPLIYPLF